MFVQGGVFYKGADMEKKKEKISITVDSDVLQAVKQLAKKDDRSLSQYINRVLKEKIEKCENS